MVKYMLEGLPTPNTLGSWEKEFDKKFGGEGTIAKTDENMILIGFTKAEVKSFIRSLLSQDRKELCEKMKSKRYVHSNGEPVIDWQDVLEIINNHQ